MGISGRITSARNVTSTPFFATRARPCGINTTQVEPREIRSFDDLLNPKWKGRIGFLDPRNAGSGQNTWAFLWKVKGEEYLGKLVQQDLLITQNQRQIAEALTKGKLAFTIGLSHYTYEPFIKAGLPVKPVPNIKEGAHANNGSGVVTIVKNPPHPNATKVFVNWLLGKEGQETLRQGDGPGNAPARCEYAMAERVRNRIVQGYHDGRGLLSPGNPPGIFGQQAQKAGDGSG